MGMLLKAFLLWAAIIPLAIANGALRDLVMTARLGAFAARAVSGLLLAGLILTLALVTVTWFGRREERAYVWIGGLWLCWTVAFEFLFGHFIAKKPWAVLLEAYSFKGGDLWPVVLLVVAIAPYVAARLRGVI